MSEPKSVNASGAAPLLECFVRRKPNGEAVKQKVIGWDAANLWLIAAETQTEEARRWLKSKRRSKRAKFEQYATRAIESLQWAVQSANSVKHSNV